MEDERSTRRSRPKRRRRRSACRPRISNAPTRRSRQSRSRCSRATELAPRCDVAPRLAVLRAAPSRAWPPSSDAWADAHLAHDHGRRRRRRLPGARALARRRRLARATRSPAAPTAALPSRSTRAPSAWSARPWRGARAWPTSPSRCRVSARARSPWSAPRRRSAQWLPEVAAGDAIAAFALSEPEAGSDVGAMRCAARADGDGYVLDGEKTWISQRRHRRLLRRVRAHATRRRGREGICGLHRRSRHAGLRDRRAHRRDRAASAGAPQLRRLPRAGGAPRRRPGEGFKVAMAHARRLPHLGGRRGARLRPPRARRGAAPRDHPANVRPDAGRPAS